MNYLNRENGSRITWLDTLKGIGIILVVLGHVYKNEFVYNWVYSFHMPLFFFVAGYVYKERSIHEDLKRRFETVIVPYFVFGAIGLVYWILVERHFRESDMTVLKAIIGLFRGQFSWLGFNVHLWFLPCFFLTTIVFNAIRKKFGVRIAYCVSLVLSLIHFTIDMRGLPWGVDRLCKFIAFYALGVASKSLLLPSIMQLKIKPNRVLFAVIGIGLLAIVSFPAQEFSDKSIIWYLCASIGIVGCILLSIYVDCRFLEYLGRASIIILCFHGPVYRVLIKIESILFRLPLEDIRKNIMSALLVIVITLVICSIIYEIVKKYFSWVIGQKSIKKYDTQ